LLIPAKPYKIQDITIDLTKDLLDIKKLKSELHIQIGDTFNIENIRKDMKIIKEKIANLGYAFARVRPDFQRNNNDSNATVSYSIDTGDKVYINDVIISGNTRTLDRIIRREVFLAPNDLYNYTDYIDTKNALQRTGFFESVKVEERKVSSNKIDILIEVKEAATGNIMVGGGYGSYGGMLLNAAISDKNIFGSGIDLGLNFDYSSKYVKFNASLHNPRIWDTQYSMGVNLYNSEYESYDYTDNRKGGSVTVGKNFTRFFSGSTSYQFVSSELSDINSTTIYYETGKSIKSSITPSISFNNTDDYYIPRSGMIGSSSIEIAGIGGDQEFIKNYNTFAYYYGLRDYINYDLILRYKARLGYIEENGYLPVNEKFYIGGIKTVRGYESGSLAPKNSDGLLIGGKMTFSNRVEASIPLIESAKMRLSCFYDYGMIGDNSFDDIARSGTGIAIEWMAPIGPVNLIFAKALDSEKDDRTTSFEFTLGTRF
jgi:outer membrane protein insertion porin family